MYPTLTLLLHPGHGFWHELQPHWLLDHGFVIVVAAVVLAAGAWLWRGSRATD